MTLLKTEGLEKNFGGVVAARDISISVAAGETVAIIGSNGAGKTTFVNMVTGYLTPSAGVIRFEGRDITGLGPRRTSRAGIRRSFQVPQLLTRLTVLENMLIAEIAAQDEGQALYRAALTSQRLTRSRAILARFSLESVADQSVGTLPQGIRKQLDIAMAAVTSPSLILLDEPTSGVSSDEKMTMMEGVIAPLRTEGATVLFIEHDMDIVRRFAERVIAFYEGTILIDGHVDAVLAHEEVRRYVIGHTHA